MMNSKSYLPAMNLVCTRSTHGDHAALARWYADHVQLLLTTRELLQAQLFRCKTVMGDAPEYLCIYDFATMPAFEAFEKSEEKAQAGRLTNAAAGRESIEIIQRTQFERLVYRRYAAAPKQCFLALYFSGQLTPSVDLSRAFADALEQARAEHAVTSTQVFVNPEAAFLLIGCAEAAQPVLLELHESVQKALAAGTLYGQLPANLKLHWAVNAAARMQWLR